MKVLLTGATGFLGKRILELLIEDPGIQRIHVVSRKPRTHPSRKVKAHQGDLILPWSHSKLTEETGSVDAIIHLAGLYDFSADYGENYRQNLLPTLNLIDWARSRSNGAKPTVIFASTYAVGAGIRGTLGEGPIDKLPSSSRAYSHTKAIAERALTDSGLPCRIFRMGVLVGDSVSGSFEKIDGPYALMEILRMVGKSALGRALPLLPVPALPEGVLPLVPVDVAARAFHQALHLPASSEPEIYGLFNPRSVKIGVLTRAIFEELLPKTRPYFVSGVDAGRRLLSIQEYFTGTPKELYRFALEPLALECPNFQRVFGKSAVPGFEDYRGAFFSGFREVSG